MPKNVKPKIPGLMSIIKVIDHDASKACPYIIVKVQWVLEIF